MIFITITAIIANQARKNKALSLFWPCATRGLDPCFGLSHRAGRLA
jgi:hypothetical protein